MGAKRTFLSLAILTLAASGLLAAGPTPQAAAAAGVECRFGITVAAWGSINIENRSVAAYDLPPMGVGYYLDWNYQRSPTVPNFISYLNVLSVSNANFEHNKSVLAVQLQNNPGALWVIGNEPDDHTGQQDDTLAETYAARFFDLATTIRATDPTAKIGFGTIIMPTTLRLMYLQRAWNKLIELSGSRAGASALVDIWTPHNFLLNEEAPSPANPAPWGSGIPLGFEAEGPIYQEKLDFTQMGDAARFKTRLVRFRQFMKDNGEQNKPLWLTEWGILAPSQQPPNSHITYFTIPEAVTAQYFADTVDWMETTADPALGLPADGDRLAQKWFWYSLNDPLYHFGGTLVNPLDLKTTLMGSSFINYEPPAGAEPSLTPDLEPLAIAAVSPLVRNRSDRSLVDYRVVVRVRNNVIHNHRSDAVISIYDESNQLLGSGTGRVSRCGGDGLGALFGITLSPGSHTLKVVVAPASGADANPNNNVKSFLVTDLGTPKEFFTPIIRK